MSESHTLDPPPQSSHPTPGVSEALPRGALIDRYVVLEALGRGGMGIVYAAYDPQLERRVAIKVLHTHLLFEETRARFLREAQALARLSHPNVVAVHDVGAYGENVFIAMEYIAGETLKQWLRREKRPVRAVLDVMLQAGRGLAAAHAAGIVHRDVKPDNVLIARDGRVVVTDFGLARAEPADRGSMPASIDPHRSSSREVARLAPATDSSGALPAADRSGGASAVSSDASLRVDSSGNHPLSDEGGVFGTVGYMSPEQAWGDPTDARSDQWSFCATLYYGLYGEPPIRSRSLEGYIRAALSRIVDPPAARRVPTWLRRVLKRGLSRSRDDRYPSMAALLAALGHDPAARWRRVAAVAGLAAALVTTVVVVASRERAAREACADGDRDVAGTWDDRAKNDVRRAFSATGARDAAATAERVVDILDEYASRWSASHRETCEATRVRHQIAEEAMYVRFACLERRRTELGALVQLFQRADAQIVERATEASYGLVPPSSCSDPGMLKSIVALPDDATERAHVLAARVALADADSLASAGKMKEALARADEALAEARASHHRGSLAEALLHIGYFQEQAGAYETADGTYAGAVAESEAAGDDATLAQAAARVAFISADKLLAHEAARRWLELAHGALARLGPNEPVEAKVLLAEASMPTAAGHPEDSIPIFDRLVPIVTRVYGAEHPITARALNNLGFTEQMLGQHERALEVHQRSAAMLERIVGVDAPSLGIFYSNIGSSLLALGRFDEAHAALERAIAIASKSDAQSFWVGWALQFEALIALRGRDAPAAIALAKRGVEIAERRGPPAARLLPALLSIEGRALVLRGDPASAEAACRRAAAVQERSGAPSADRVYEWDPLACLGEALLARGKVDDALPLLERSAALPRRVYPGDLAVARFLLARALTAPKKDARGGADPARARVLAEGAEKELAVAAGRTREHEEVARWLAAREKERDK